MHACFRGEVQSKERLVLRSPTSTHSSGLEFGASNEAGNQTIPTVRIPSAPPVPRV